ncbi:hypothetical protein S83_065616, partial [Arachis hypogaea]
EDHDMCVPFIESEAWTRSLAYKIIDEWRPWNSNGPIAGICQRIIQKITFSEYSGKLE